MSTGRARHSVGQAGRPRIDLGARRRAEKGLLREPVLSEGRLVFDPKLAPHRHFVDDETQAITDVPWEALQVRHVESLRGFAVREYQVVLRGRRTATQR